MTDDRPTAEDQADADSLSDGLDRVPMSTRYGCTVMIVGVAVLYVLSWHGRAFFQFVMGE